MDITSIAEGKVALRMTPLTIDSIINNAIESLQPVLESRGKSLPARFLLTASR